LTISRNNATIQKQRGQGILKTLGMSWKFYRKWLGSGLYVILLGFFANTFSLVLPQISRLIIDFVFIGDSSSLISLKGIWATMLDGRFGEVGSWTLLIWLCSFFLGFVFLKNLILFFKNVFWNNYAQEFGKEVKSFGYSIFTERSQYDSAGESFVLLTNDVGSFVNIFAYNMTYCIENILVVAIASFFTFSINSSLGLLILACLPVAIVICVVFLIKSKSILESSREEYSSLSFVAQESLNASRSLKSFGVSNLVTSRFGSSNQKYFGAKKNEVNIIASYVLCLDIFKSISYALMIIAGIIFASRCIITTGEFVSFIAYALTIFLEAVKLFKNIFDLKNVLVSAKRFSKFVKLKNKTVSLKAKAMITRPPEIIIEKLNISFKEKEVLSKISLEIPYGKHVAIVGHQGEGKSVLAQALLRFMDADSGSISINGLDIKEINAESLRNQFSFVPQEPFLFSYSIKENIMYSNPNGEISAMLEAIKITKLDRWLSKVKGGENLVVSENGVGIPSQERQLISFARAIYKNAPILMLDSPFSVFSDTQANELRKDLFDLYSTRTIILATNHPADAMECDLVLYLEKGKIVEQGSPQELMDKNEKFAEFTRKKISDIDEI